MAEDKELRKHLSELLEKGNAHITLAEAVRDFPKDKAGVRPAGSPHSAWELLEHIRITQQDILQFSGGSDSTSRTSEDRHPPAGYISLKWPDEYWPASQTPPDPNAWEKCVQAISDDLANFVQLISDPHQDLFRAFPWGEGQTLLREALLIADHTSYHLGQLVLVKRMIAHGTS